MPRKRTKHWSRTVEEAGVDVRLYERPGSPYVWYSIAEGGRKIRRSLETRDRRLAEERARAVARGVAEARLTGVDVRRGLALGQLFTLYQRERLPNIPSLARRQFAETRIRLFLDAWGRDFAVLDLSQAHVDRYARARREGRLAAYEDGRTAAGVKDGTIDGDFRWLRSVYNFARRHRANGRPVLPENPLDALTWPKEVNQARPVASQDRYVRTQEHADTVDPPGRLRCILALARFTGRRETAICRLRVSDVLRTPEAIREALAAAGMDEGVAEYMPHGAIRWPAETDKQGFLFVAPLSKPARDELDRYLRTSPRLGDVPLFPGTRPERKRKGTVRGVDPRLEPIRRDVAARWLLKAEELAGLPKLARGVFHPYRRLWATERKGLPAKDVAAAGGWRDVATMELAYQQADAKTALSVVQHGT